jgi:hypothetical protein
MVYSVMVFAPRKAGVTREYFKQRYERHMKMIETLCADAPPVSHKRWYPIADENDKPVMMGGDPDGMPYAAILVMEFEDEEGFKRFYGALLQEEANAKIMADEAGFWEREGMKVMAVESRSTWGS